MSHLQGMQLLLSRSRCSTNAITPSLNLSHLHHTCNDLTRPRVNTLLHQANLHTILPHTDHLILSLVCIQHPEGRTPARPSWEVNTRSPCHRSNSLRLCSSITRHNRLP